MNPLSWPGGWFLAFYALLCAALVVVARRLRRRIEVGDEETPVLTDPYLIAYLRAGKNEALRVCVVSLLDRQLLRRAGKDDLVAAAPDAKEAVRRPMERALLAHFAAPRPAASIFADPALLASTRGFEDELGRRGLVVDAKTRLRRVLVTLPFLAVAAAVGVARLQQALAAGRSNVGFLVALMLVAGLFFFAGILRRRSYRGDAALGDLRSLFGALKQRRGWVDTGGRTSEVALLAAVYGLAFLPAELAFARELYRQGVPSGSDVVTGYSGNGGGSSCGSTCGSSCGGGGCGGGCGGCGS